MRSKSWSELGIGWSVFHRLIPLLVLVLIAIACGPKGPRAKFGEGPIVVAKASAETSPLERKMHARLNRDRAKQGLGPLTFDAALADVARGHSQDMHELGFFAHESKRTGTLEDRLDRAGILVLAARENLGEGPNVDGTEDALLASPGHYANIMATDVTHIGIGIVSVGTKAEPRLLVTQVFATPANPETPAVVRASMLKRIAEARQKAGLPPLPSHPLLDSLAKKHVAEIKDDLDSATDRIGDEVTKELVGTELSGVVVGASAFVSVELYQASGAAVTSKARAIGIATTTGHDARGRPVLQALVLIGL